MRQWFKWCAAAVIMAGLFACGDDKDDKTPTGDPAAVFPLELGNVWMYHHTGYFGPHNGATDNDDESVDEYVILIADSSTTSPNGVVAVRLSAAVVNNPTEIDLNSPNLPDSLDFQQDFLVNLDEGLHLVGSQNQNGPVVVFAPFRGMEFRRNVNAGINQSRTGITWFEHPSEPEGNLLRAYPGASGQEWTFQPDTENWLPTQHRIVGKVSVETPAGYFMCLEKKVSYVWDSGVSTTIEYSTPGIVSFYSDYGIQEIMNSEGESIGSFHTWEKYELTEFHVGQ
jgi:hypothetical protein